ncbi:MAG: DJ-1 family glyoxalase III [Campylobacterota bacterium]|nr:DJ-1 family glyoxalase III [Campylobacterota bacterium]
MCKILVPLTQGHEEIEAISIIDILRRAEIDVTTVGLDSTKIIGSHNIEIKADILLEKIDANEFNGIVLPGGMPGTLHLKHSDSIKKIIQTMHQDDKFIGAICAAPMVLENAGILTDKKFTIHPGVIDDIDLTPESARVVEDGNIITGQASGAATLFALTIVKKLKGEKMMNKVNAGVLFKY